MERCQHEDGSSQVACVWVGSQQGDGVGDSFIKLADGQTALITNWAGEILVATPGYNAPVTSAQPVEVQQVAPVQQVPSSVTTNSATGDWTQGYPPCSTETDNGCYWDAQAMGNGLGVSLVADYEGNITYGKW